MAPCQAQAVPLLGAFLQRHGIGAVSLREGGSRRWWRKEWREQLAAGRAVDVFRTHAACRAIVLEAGASAAECLPALADRLFRAASGRAVRLGDEGALAVVDSEGE